MFLTDAAFEADTQTLVGGETALPGHTKRLVCLTENDASLVCLSTSQDAVSVISVEGPNCQLSVAKSWPFHSAPIKILYEHKSLVVFLDHQHRLQLTNARNQSVRHCLCNEHLDQAYVLGFQEPDTWLIVAEMNNAVHLLRISDHVQIESVVLVEEPLAKPIWHRDGRLLLQTAAQAVMIAIKTPAPSCLADAVSSKTHIPLHCDGLEPGATTETSGEIICYNKSETELTVAIADESGAMRIISSMAIKDSMLGQPAPVFGSFLCFTGNMQRLRWFLNSLHRKQQGADGNQTGHWQIIHAAASHLPQHLWRHD